MEENSKKCIHCKEVKRLDLFRRNQKCKSGIGNVCKKCYYIKQANKSKGVENFVNKTMFGLDDSDRW